MKSNDAASLFVAVCLIALPYSIALAASKIEVSGTRDPAIDVPAVQAAVDTVDAGGTVALAGTFDFGLDQMGYFWNPEKFKADQTSVDEATKELPYTKGKSTVFIHKSVTIQGSSGAKIIGGRPAFWIGWDGDILPSAPISGPAGWIPGDDGVDWIPVAWGDYSYGPRDKHGHSTYNMFYNPYWTKPLRCRSAVVT